MAEQIRKQGNQASQEVLLAQLQILNERSRWYSGQLWQIPFLYLTITGAFVGQVIDKANHLLPIAMLVAGLFGSIVSYHMRKLKDGEERAVKALIEIESRLRIPKRAEHRKEYTDILFWAVLGTGAVFLVGGAVLIAVNSGIPVMLKKWFV